MENYIVFLMVVLAYFDIKAILKKILNNQSKDNKKDFSLLEKLKGKEVQIEIDDDSADVFSTSRKGILKDFNDVWLILESTTKKGNELVYHRITNIKGVLEIK